MRWLIKNIGLCLVAIAILCAANAVDNWADALKQNTAQTANVVACKGSSMTAENQLAASIDASLLRRFAR